MPNSLLSGISVRRVRVGGLSVSVGGFGLSGLSVTNVAVSGVIIGGFCCEWWYVHCCGTLFWVICE